MKKIIIAFAVVALLGAGAYYLSEWYRSGDWQRYAVEKVSERIAPGDQTALSFLEELLGFDRPQTYLFLFLNNTELRPGGGFIGSYAVVRLERGKPTVLKVEGTEILDNNAPRDFESVPPAPLKEYLKISRWGFRDSNWWPDFTVSSRKSLELYKLEKGEAADEIAAVIGFTPTVVEEILKIAGPVTVRGEEFNAANFTEKLEYEVEYGYANRGLDFDERKTILQELVRALASKLTGSLLLHNRDYLALSERMLAEKHLMAYAVDENIQKQLSKQEWSGEMNASEGDYLLWADANLGALKTDVAVNRELTYKIYPDKNGTFIAEARMRYDHRGKFDWRTTRYRDYARVYVPAGSKLIDVTGGMKTDRSKEAGKADTGAELGRTWFGAFISIEPGSKGELVFRYSLAPAVAAQIKKGDYSLLAQKQPGTLGVKLTLSLDFGKNLGGAEPKEEEENYGDTRYDLTTDLRVDRQFSVKLK